MIQTRTATQIPLVDLGLANGPVADELREAFERILTSSAFIAGREVETFERELAAYVGSEFALGVSSGTSALQLALEAAGIGPGDEVILPPNTFFATAEAVVAAGASVVFADADPQTALIDLGAVRAAITPRTAAVIPVHLYGQPVDMTALRAVAAGHGLFVLEDACQAIGAEWEGRRAGSLGDAAAFSFYPGKNLGALGDAGGVTTSSRALADRIRLLANHGPESKYNHTVSGYNHRMDGLQGAFLSVKLKRLDEMQALRDAAVRRYQHALAAVSGARLLRTQPGARCVHHLMVVRVDNRDRIVAELQESGVGASVHYPRPIHLEPAWRERGGAPGQFPNAEALAASVLSLPLYPGITDEQIDYSVEMLAAAIAAGSGS